MADIDQNGNGNLLGQADNQTVTNYLILKEGFEETVRIKLGVRNSELGNEVINSKFIANLSESYIITRVPRYSEITDAIELLYLESAVINYMCYLLCPSMRRRVNLEVSSLDVKWKKDKVDWDKLALGFLGEVESDLDKIESVPVDEDSVESSLAALIQPGGERIV